MTKTMGYLVSCEGRQLFMRDRTDVEWALSDSNYTVTELVAKKGEESVINIASSTDDTQERLQLLEELFELEEVQIAQLKTRMEEAVELVESIHEFASKQTNNIMESRGLLLLIAEACSKWLMPKE